MVMIQHPAGRPKQVSIVNCKVMGARVAGVTSALTDFGHGCDTLNGSSGSPAIDIQTGRVLGLHHLGYLPTDEPVNRAVQIQQILDFLRTNLRDALARQALNFYLSLPNYTNNWLRLGFSESDLADGGSDRLVDALITWGDEDAIRARVEAHFAAGADQVALQVLNEDKLSVLGTLVPALV